MATVTVSEYARPIRVASIGDEPVGVVPLTQGYEAVIDVADVPLAAGFSWIAFVRPHGVYARVAHGGPLLHRLILSPERGELVDHIDHDGLNNRRANLRLVDGHQNMANQRGNRDTSSRYKGVTYQDGLRRPWRAQIWVRGKNIRLGSHASEAAAARAYDAAACDAFGEYACLNFPQEVPR